MDVLSRQEEDRIVKQVKKESREACSSDISAFIECSRSRTVSVIWACRSQQKGMNACLKGLMTEDRINDAKIDYLRRKQKEV